MWDIPRPIDDRLRLAIAKALAAVNNRIGISRADWPGILVVGDEDALAQPRNRFLQRADAIAQDFRQHRDDIAGEVSAVAPLLCFQIERRAFFHEIGDIGDVYTQFPIPAFDLLEADGIVVIFGIIWVDR